MKEIIIERLHCTEAEDWWGDETRLEVYNDGELYFAYRRDMDDGDSWEINSSVWANRSCTFRLFDDDGGFLDGHDPLGVATIDLRTTNHGTVSFTEDEANYTLTYSVVDRPEFAETDLVLWAIDQFEASTAPGVWPTIRKEWVIADLRDRYANPLHIRQVDRNFCGPTSIVYELARTQPRRYVDLTRQLFETGGFWARSEHIAASNTLLNAQIDPNSGMAAVDWMLIATMRNEENAIFGTSPNSTGVLSALEGMTSHWEMEGWTDEILLKNNIANTTTFSWGEFDAIRYADEVYRAGGSAFIMMLTDMLNTDDSGGGGVIPEHWIVYRGGLDESGGRIRFQAYSWGQIYNVDNSRDHFENCMYGIVTGF